MNIYHIPKYLLLRLSIIKLALIVLSISILASVSIFSFSHNESLVGGSNQAKVETKRKRLSKSERIRLIDAIAQGEKYITVLLVCEKGSNQNLINEAGYLSAIVQYKAEDIGYLRLKLPIENVERLLQLKEIESFAVDGDALYFNNQHNDKEKKVLKRESIQPPNKYTKPENPFLPSHEIGAPQFVKANPTFDGRGVTVAIVDFSIDALLPELQTAKILDGTSTRKMVDFVTGIPDTIDHNDDPGNTPGSYVKIEMKDQLVAVNKLATYGGNVYQTPSDGVYRIGTFDERTVDEKGDLNFDGNPEGSTSVIDVLWEEKSKSVWIDTNQNKNFADDQVMSDYLYKPEFGIFGKDNPATPIRETIGYSIKIVEHHKLILLIPGSNQHGTGVTGGAFGKNFFGGQITGVAPETQLVSVLFGVEKGIIHSYIESLIAAFRHPKVDVVTSQIGIGMVLNDGNSLLSIVINRLVKRYEKPMFAGVANLGEAVNFVDENASADEVIAVGSYLNRETSIVNYGMSTRYKDNIDGASAYGPRKDGGFKPDVLAPTLTLTTYPGHLKPSNFFKGEYPLQPGYAVFGGTSTATPMAAAAAALLISAAKQTGVKYDVDRIRWALKVSARFLPNYQAIEQGAGLIQIEAAWKALKEMANPVKINSSAPVKVRMGDQLKYPNNGPGIFEREGWIVGDKGSRHITLIRESGISASVTYNLRWLGNDGTFSSKNSVKLPLNTPVTVKVNIAPKVSGVHSAVLNLDEVNGIPGVYQIMNTIIAGENFKQANKYTLSSQGQFEWLRKRSFFFHIPENAPAFKIDVNIEEGIIMPFLMRPSGTLYYELRRRPAVMPYYQTKGVWSRVITTPEPGTWQLVLYNANCLDESRFISPLAKYTSTITLLGVDTSLNNSAMSFSDMDSENIKEILISNKYAPFIGRVEEGGIGSARSLSVEMYSTELPKVFEVVVPAGAREFKASINNLSDDASDIDLYLYDCTGKICELKDFSQLTTSNESVRVPEPSPGRWKIIVDPYKIIKNKVAFEYQDIIFHPDFGKIISIENSTIHEYRDTWTQHFKVHITSKPGDNRYFIWNAAIVAEVSPNSWEYIKTLDGLVPNYSRYGVISVNSISEKIIIQSQPK